MAEQHFNIDNEASENRAIRKGWATRHELEAASHICSLAERRGLSRILNGMKQRCHNPDCNAYKRYGARGISVCDRWRNSLLAFIHDMGPRPSPKHSIDRYPDNDGNYEPGNCRWATDAEQRANQCYSYYVLHDGTPLTIREFTALNQMKTRDVFAAFKDGSLVECCKDGHPFTPDNIYHYTQRRRKPGRACRTCRYLCNRRAVAKLQAAAGGKKRESIRKLPPHLARNLNSATTVEAV